VIGGDSRSLNKIQGDRPAWSPSGSWIAYQQVAYAADGLVHSELRIVRPSGGDSHTVWNPTAHEGLAFSWSPDSTRIAFLTESGEIGVATVTGKVTIFKLPTNIVATSYSINGVPNTPPQWSANGRTLTFTAAPRSDRKDLHVYAINTDGLSFHRVS
jgi:Tol biopolymer transport system component